MICRYCCLLVVVLCSTLSLYAQQDIGNEASEQYAVLENGKITLFYDEEKSNRTGTILSGKEEWANHAEEITECVIDPSFADLKLQSLSEFFMGWKSLKSIVGLEYLNTAEVTNMSKMFSDCSSLTNADVSKFNTEKVTNMNRMFNNCYSLTSLDVSGFKTDKVKNMNRMFYKCSSLTKLDVSKFNTSSVTGMTCMFYDCEGLTSLDVSKFNTDNVTDMSCMFYNCSGLTSLDVSRFNTENVTDMSFMFYNCSGLPSLNVSGFKTLKVNNMKYMFYNYLGQSVLDVSGFKTDSVTNMSWMFGNCKNLKNLDLSGFNTSRVADMSKMFAWDEELTTIRASERWTMQSIENAQNMFQGCSKILGGEGTKYNKDYIDGQFARVDQGVNSPGYFTYHAPQFYTLLYMVDNEEYKSVYLKVGASIVVEAMPTKEGYTFSGWRDVPSTMPARDVMVRGSFSINKYKLTYMIDNRVYKEVIYDYGTPITPEPKPQGDYDTFEWVDLPQTMPAHDVVVYASYTSGIGDVLFENVGISRVFSIDGRSLKELQKGLNIIRMDNGMTRKVIVR